MFFQSENREIEDPDLFEGDIKLTEDQRAEVEARGERASINYRLWPNAVIIYDVESSIGKHFITVSSLSSLIYAMVFRSDSSPC